MDNSQKGNSTPNSTLNPFNPKTLASIYNTLKNTPAPHQIFLNCGIASVCISTNSNYVLDSIQEFYSPLIIDKPAFLAAPCQRSITFLDQDFLGATDLPTLDCSRSLESTYKSLDWDSFFGAFGSSPPPISSWLPVFLNKTPKKPKSGKRAKLEYYDSSPESDAETHPHPLRIINKTGKHLFFLYSLLDPVSPHIALGSFSRGHESFNQVVNHFFNWVLESQLHKSNHILFHAGGVMKNDKSLIIAGAKGMGKTTLILKLAGIGWKFLSNDRILVKFEDGGEGVDTTTSISRVFCFPKHPRALPGTLYTISQLTNLLPKNILDDISVMKSPLEYRKLSSKFTINVFQQFPKSVIQNVSLNFPFDSLLILSWEWESLEPTSLQKMNWDSPLDYQLLTDYLPEISKHSGCIYHTEIENSGFLGNWDSEKYRQVLKTASVYFVRGKVDFDALQELILQTVE